MDANCECDPWDGVGHSVTAARENLKLANNTIYGLAAGVWTKDVSKAHRMARSLKAGTVWINAYNLYDAAISFGGYKESGFGRELGEAALESYTQLKSVWLKL